MSAQPKVDLTPAEYLAFERASPHKHEFYAGQIYAMAGGSRSHNLIVGNIMRELGTQLRKRNCTLYPSDMRVKIEQIGLYTYPDITVVCGEELFEDEQQDVLLNPTVLIEVLSNSTERYDRGKKFKNYRTIPSFVEYLLVAQASYSIEHFVRQPDGQWLMSEADQLEHTIVLESIHCALQLADVYEKVVLVHDTDDDEGAL